jgi:hypothetical protein
VLIGSPRPRPVERGRSVARGNTVIANDLKSVFRRALLGVSFRVERFNSISVIDS